MIYIGTGVLGFIVIHLFDLVSLKRIPFGVKPIVWVAGFAILFFSLIKLCLQSNTLPIPVYLTWVGWLLLAISVTIIMFDISRPSHVHLNLLDVGGHMVATVFDGELGSGTHRIQWNGKTSAGAEATSGVYFMRLEVGDVVASRKLVLLK